VIDSWPWLRPYTEPMPSSQALGQFWSEMQPNLDSRNQCHADRSRGVGCWCGWHKGLHR